MILHWARLKFYEFQTMVSYIDILLKFISYVSCYATTSV